MNASLDKLTLLTSYPVLYRFMSFDKWKNNKFIFKLKWMSTNLLLLFKSANQYEHKSPALDKKEQTKDNQKYIFTKKFWLKIYYRLNKKNRIWLVLWIWNQFQRKMIIFQKSSCVYMSCFSWAAQLSDITQKEILYWSSIAGLLFKIR